MSKLGIYIVEDEILYLNKMMMVVENLDYDVVGNSDNSDTAMVEITKLNPDLILMDIGISGTMDGVELSNKIRKTSIIPTIFVTSFSDEKTFDRVKETGACAFITKPIDEKSLQRSIELAIGSIDQKKEEIQEWNADIIFEDAVFIKSRHKIEKVKIDDILYLEVEDRYSTIFSAKGKHVLRMSMGEVQEKLPKERFARTHRKFTINLSKIDSINTQDNLIQIGDIEIPISRSYKELLLQKLDWMQ